MAEQFFPDVPKIKYEGPDSKNPLAFKHYNADEVVAGKSMREHFRFSMCYWHGMTNDLSDPFGVGTRIMPWRQADDPMQAAEQTMHAMFEARSEERV